MTTPTTTPYDPQIPLTSTNVPTGQTEFLNNFSKLFEAFGENHVALNDPTNPGNHEVVQLVEQKNKRTTQNQEIAVYSKKVDGQTDQLFMRYQSNGKEFQITEYQIYSVDPSIFQTSYFTFLPGGIVVQFGKIFSFGTDYLLGVVVPITKSLSGVSLGGIEVAGVFPPPQPNVSLNVPVNGVYQSIVLKSSVPMVNQFYLFFGNI